jgi:hypothetical protein
VVRLANPGVVTDLSSNQLGNGQLFQVDVTAPTIAGVTVNRSVPGAITAGDTYVLTFSKPVSGSLSNASFATTSGGKFGDTAQFTWTSSTVLTITVGTGGSLIANGDAVALASATAITDQVGLGVGTTAFMTVDLNTVTVTGVRVTRAANNQFQAGDTIAITFSRATNAPALTAANFTVRAGAFGTGATFQWSAGNTVLTITGAGTPTLQTADIVRLANGNTIRDTGGNAFGTGNLFVADLTAPVVQGVKVTRATDTQFNAGDTIEISFSEPTNAPTNLTLADFTVGGGHSFGTGATFTWNAPHTVLTITGAGTPTLADGDTVALASGARIQDIAGNALGTASLCTADLTAPAVLSQVTTRATDGVFAANDTIKLTFSEPTNAPAMTEADLVVSYGSGSIRANALGTGATYVWSAGGTVLTITGAGTPALQDGDVVTLATGNKITDLAGNPFGTAPTLFTADLTAPTVLSMQVVRKTDGQFTAAAPADTIKITFSEPVNAPTDLQDADFVVKDASNNVHSFDTATFTWNVAKTVLTITAAGTPTIQTGDTVKLATAARIADTAGLGFGTATALFTVDLSAATVTTTAAANGTGTAGVIDQGDTITLTFDKAFVTPGDPDITAGQLVLSAGDFGTGATAHWSDATHLVITLGASPTITGAETISFSAAYAATLTDIHGMKAATALGAVPAATQF